MNRPSKEQVDELLEMVEADSPDLPPEETCRVLAAEVRALREACELNDHEMEQFAECRDELAKANASLSVKRNTISANHELIDELRATIARVGVLPAKWRDNYGTDYEMHRGEDADELEAALRGEP